MVHCCVLGCGNRSERKSENVTFHTFPKYDETRNRWIAFTGRKNWKPSKYDRMCSNHFESYCFYKTKFKVYLKNLALPTLCKFRTTDTVVKSRSPVSKQGPQSMLRVPSYQSTPYNVKELNKKMAKSSQVLGNTGVVETDLYMKESQEDVMNHEDEETDDAVNEDSDKEDNVEMPFNPMCMPVHTTLTVKDEVFDPEDNFPHSIEVTVECDVEDAELNNTRDPTRNASNLTASGEPKAPYLRGWGHKGRPPTVQLVKPVRPLVEKYTIDEDVDLPHDKQERNTNVPETEKNGIDKEDNEEANEEDDLEDYQWKPVKGYQSLKRPFLQKYAGPTSVFTSPYATFRAFWDNSILSYIATETNRYVYTQSITDETNDWVETNIDEILILFAFWIMLGIIKMPTIKACYAHNVPILRTDVFRRLFTESRYMNLVKSFYVVDDSRDPNDPDDVLFHLRTLIDHLNVTFKDHCNLEQDISIDETSNLWKTNCPLGIKIHHLCESKTGYIWSFLVDAHRKTVTSSLPDVVYVMKLMQPLLHLGHTLFTDSWFSTPVLARYLKHKHTNFVGTLRCFKDIPPIIKNATLNEGEFVARHCGDMLAVSCNGGKRQYYLSTYHGVSQICDPDVEPSGQYKLTVADDYERGMRKIDRMDYCVEPYLEQQIKWPLKLFKILLNMTIYNAHVLLEKSTNVKIDSLGFRLSLVQAIIERHHNNVPRVEPTANLPAERLTGRHFVRRISLPGEEFGAKVNMCMIRKTCVWCTHNGRDTKTAFECPDCNVPLCLDVCFEEFHTISG